MATTLRPGSLAAATDLTERVAIVTGAAGGIGLATSRLLAEAGAHVVMADVASGVMDRAREIGNARATGCVVDVSQKAQVDALVEECVSRHGRLDIMVNNAAVIVSVPILELSEEDLDRQIAVNLKGVFFGCQAAARVMRQQSRGVIINMASEAIDAGAAVVVGYAMTKAAVAKLTHCIAAEAGAWGIRVNAIAPGFIESPMTGRHYTAADGTVDEAKRREIIAAFTANTKLDHIGQPVDIAHAVLFLASDASRYMTGQILRPNGGGSMPW